MFLLGIALICSVYGVYGVYKATVGMAAGGALTNPTKFVVVQVFSIILGIVAFVVFTIIDVDILGQNWRVLHIINIALLVLLIVFGQDDGTGNKSWSSDVCSSDLATRAGYVSPVSVFSRRSLSKYSTSSSRQSR